MSTPLRLLVFAKAPIPGQVKTRLIPALGVAGATSLYSWLLEATLAAASDVPDSTLELWCAPLAEHPDLLRLAGHYGATLHVQHGPHLGARMLHAQQSTSRTGPSLLFGSDCPDLHSRDLLAARKCLEETGTLVFIPTFDGGYILIGAQRPAPEVLGELDWGTHSVMAQTRALLYRRSLSWKELPMKRDIDRPTDLVYLPPVWRRQLGWPDSLTMDSTHEC